MFLLIAISIFIFMFTRRTLNSQIILNILSYLQLSFSPDVGTKNRDQHPRIDTNGKDQNKDQKEYQTNRISTSSHHR